MTEMNHMETAEPKEAGADELVSVLLETVKECFAEGDEQTLRLVLNDEHEADLAAAMRHLSEEEQQIAFRTLALPLAARVMAELDQATASDVSDAISDNEVSDLVQMMAPDDAADTLGVLQVERAERVLDLMADEEAQEARELLSYPEDTGGGIMNPDLISVSEQMTVSDGIDYVRSWVEADEVFYIYVVDAQNRLIGTVSLRRLVLARPDARIGDVMDTDPVSVDVAQDQEEIARAFDRYDYLALPVVSESGELLGQITVDDIVDVLEEEATEDIYEMAGTSREEQGERSVLGVARHRMPWLVVCLGGTLLSGVVIEVFSDLLSKVIALSLFIPAIMAMGGNTGIQTSTVTVRSLAMGQVQVAGALGVLWREIRVALSMGICLGLLATAAGWIWTGGATLGICVGLSMISAVVLSASIGALLPVVFWRLGIDPAVASGPLITTLNDIVSLTVYFCVALGLLGQLS